jgi:hypothetical protein
VGALVMPVLTYVLQPRSCFQHLFLPYVLPVLVLLCIAGGAAQSFIRWPAALQVTLGIVFAVAIQAVSLVPCISSLEDSPRVVRLSAVSLGMTCFAATVLFATAIELCRGGAFQVSRTVAGAGFAVAGLSLALGATKQYLGITGVGISSDAFAALAEARMPVWLMAGVGVAAFGIATTYAQRWNASAQGSAA